MGSMIDIFLRVPTREILQEALPFLWNDRFNFWVSGSPEFSFDPIGPVVVTPATYDEDGEQLTQAIVDNRFHANLRCTEELAALVPLDIQVFPEHPVRAFA